MKFHKFNYYQYKLNYYLLPGQWMTSDELQALRRQLVTVNGKSGRNFKYGIFDENLSIDEQNEFFKNMNLCLINDGDEPIGFFYNLVLCEGPVPVIHAGLVVVNRNNGVDLIGYPYSHMTYLQYKKYGSHYYTNISSTPSIVGVFSDSFSNVWPNYRGNQLKPPSKEYLKVLEMLELKYIKKYFKNDGLEVDKKRFVLKSPSREMGFETDLKKLSRYHKSEANYFCMFWLDYSKGEDLIQVGRVTLAAIARIRLYYAIRKVKSLMTSKPKGHPSQSL